MNEGEDRLANVRMSIFSLDSNLNTVLLRYLLRPAKRPVKTVLAFLFGHPLSS
jgi:hypothetical protein